MRQCANCLTESQDHVVECPNCGNDLRTDSVRARALKNILETPRSRFVRVVAWHDCCPACRAVEGAHPIENIPDLPVPGCSGAHGCRCQYEPVLLEVGP